MKIRYFGYLVLLCMLFFAGLIPIIYKIGSSINVIQLSALVALVGTVCSLVYMLYKGGQKHILGYLTNWKQLLSLAIVGIYFSVVTVIFSYTTHYVGASLVAVIYRSWPLLMLLFAPFLLSEKIDKWDIAAVSVGFLGVAATLIGNTPISIPASAIPFVAILLFAAVIGAITGAVEKRYQYEISSSVFMYNLIAFVVLLPFVIINPTSVFSGLTLSSISIILFLGLVQNLLLTLLTVTALRTVKTSLAANAMTIIPFITLILSAIIIHENIASYYLVIAGTVLIGVLIHKFAPHKANYLSKSKHNSSPTIYDVTSAFIKTKSDLIYGQMKGSGRVLAFSKSIANGSLDKYINIMNQSSNSTENCVIFSNMTSTSEIKPDELDFIKEIMGHNEDDLLVLGVGAPEAVEDRFADIHSRLNELG